MNRLQGWSFDQEVTLFMPLSGVCVMDKKAKKKIQTLNERIQKLRQQRAGVKKQMDDPSELETLEKQIADAEAELAKLKASG